MNTVSLYKRMPMLKWLWLSVVVVVLDQLSKQWIVSLLVLHEKWPIFPDPILVKELAMQNQLPAYGFNFTVVHNYGAAFGFLSNAGGWQFWFFLTIGVVVTVMIIRWLAKLAPTAKLEAMSYGLLLGGVVGNIIDRIWHGYVIDFLQFYANFLKPILGGSYFPSFNLADSAIFLGVVLLIWDMVRDMRGQKA